LNIGSPVPQQPDSSYDGLPTDKDYNIYEDLKSNEIFFPYYVLDKSKLG
jgi:hypothetical protein